MTAVRIVARIVDAACFPLVVLVRAWDAADRRLAETYANGLPGDDE